MNGTSIAMLLFLHNDLSEHDVDMTREGPPTFNAGRFSRPVCVMEAPKHALRAAGASRVGPVSPISAPPGQRKNTNQTMPRIKTASPVDTVNSASTDGPGSAPRASVGVSTI